MTRLNPFATKQRELQKKLEADRNAKRAQILKDKKSKDGKAKKTARTAAYNTL